MSNEARALADNHGGIWSEHTRHGVSDWQLEVSEDNTRASYWDWVLSQIDEETDGVIISDK